MAAMKVRRKRDWSMVISFMRVVKSRKSESQFLLMKEKPVAFEVGDAN
ncbi:hypothetical protein [Azospirillum sp.]